jgi:hypothetical protein
LQGGSFGFSRGGHGVVLEEELVRFGLFLPRLTLLLLDLLVLETASLLVFILLLIAALRTVFVDL